MMFANLVLIDDVLNEMTRVRSLLCEPAESLQYIVGMSELQWITFTKNTPAWGESAATVVDSPIVGLLSDFIFNPREHEQYGLEAKDYIELQQNSILPLTDFIEQHSCNDYNSLKSSAATVGNRLWAITGEDSYLKMTTCQEVQHHCLRADIVGINVRFMCSDTCGCSGIYSGLWDMARSGWGCPEIRCRDRMLKTLKSSAQCQDSNLTYLEQTGWGFLIDRLRETNHITEIQHSNLTNLGCEAVKFIPSVKKYTTFEWRQFYDLCSLDEGAKNYGLASFCPVSCGCSNAVSHGAKANCSGLCPKKCCQL